MTGKSDRSYDWSVAFILLMVAVFTASFIPKNRIDWSIWRAARAIALLGPAQGPDRPDVLILSRQADDRFAVTSTLAPRGYVIHVVTTAEAALAELRQQPSRIGIVVVDEALPETRKVLLAARKFCPEACPILLKGQREPAQIARIVMDSLDRHLTPEQARGLRQQAALKKGPASR